MRRFAATARSAEESVKATPSRNALRPDLLRLGESLLACLLLLACAGFDHLVADPDLVGLAEPAVPRFPLGHASMLVEPPAWNRTRSCCLQHSRAAIDTSEARRQRGVVLPRLARRSMAARARAITYLPLCPVLPRPHDRGHLTVLEPVMGVEPTESRLRGERRSTPAPPAWSRRRESNPLPLAYHASACPHLLRRLGDGGENRTPILSL